MYSDPSALEDVAFLASSPNRLDVFGAIRAEPRPRYDLRGSTDASRVTLSRILRDLEDRGWIEQSGGAYTLTPRGTVVKREVAQLFANLEALEGLDDSLPWLPVELFDFDLACLADATVVTSTERNVTAAITHMATCIREATRVRNVARGISSEVVAAYVESATHEERSLETILCASVFGTISRDAVLRNQLDAMLASDRITVLRYDGPEPPIILTVADDVVHMCGQSTPKSPPESLETSDDRVRRWAVSYIDDIRARATPVHPGAFTA